MIGGPIEIMAGLGRGSDVAGVTCRQVERESRSVRPSHSENLKIIR